MSNSPFSRSALAPLVPWIVPAAGFAVVVAAVWSYARTGEVQAGGGSPYYDAAVKQALVGLRNVGGGGEDAPAGRPPLPAGLNPADYYWCEQCKTYHKREPGAQPAGQPAVAAVDPFAPPPLLQRPPEIPAAGAAAPAVAAPGGAAPGGAAAIPPLPAGLNPADYYWCEQCKAYHQREPGAQPAAHPAPPADLPPADPFAPPPLLERPPEVGGTPGTQVIPPLPAGLNPADYQWDAESKSYRLRRGG